MLFSILFATACIQDAFSTHEDVSATCQPVKDGAKAEIEAIYDEIKI